MATESPAAANGVHAAPLSPLDVLTLAEAAAYLRLPEDAVRAEADAGRLVGQCVRGEWRFVRAAVVAWLQAPPAPVRPQPGGPSDARARLLAVAGCLADDQTLEPMVEEIIRERKQHPVGE